MYALRPQSFYLGVGVAIAGLLLSAFLAKESIHYARPEAKLHHSARSEAVVGSKAVSPRRPSLREIFALTTWKDRDLFSCSHAGLVNNLNDGMSWGI